MSKARIIGWRAKMRAEKRCTRCGQPRGKSPYAENCTPCMAKKRDEQRRRRGSGMWRKGGPGRPPKLGDRRVKKHPLMPDY